MIMACECEQLHNYTAELSIQVMQHVYSIVITCQESSLSLTYIYICIIYTVKILQCAVYYSKVYISNHGRMKPLFSMQVSAG